MQIQNSQSMFQHIENGGNLALNKQGQLETQGAAGRFFQKIGDAFRSLTSSGRAAIETRNAHLNTAMANMLRDNTLFNPTQGEIPHPMTKTERNSLAMRLGMAQALRNFPPESRAAAQNLGLQLLRLQGLPEQGNSAEARGKALEVMNKILGDDVVVNILRCDYEPSHADLEPMLREISEDIPGGFLHQCQRGEIKDGIAKTYYADIKRGCVEKLDGKKPNVESDETIAAELKNLFPDPKLSGFISLMLSQSGLEFQLTQQFEEAGRAKDNPNLPDLIGMMEKGFAAVTPHHRYSIRVEDGKARISAEIDRMLMPVMLTQVARTLGVNFATPGNRVAEQPLGGGRYTIEMEIDLGQDMTGKEVPDFKLVSASRKPIIIPPSISAQ
jgi:hypothetical protein